MPAAGVTALRGAADQGTERGALPMGGAVHALRILPVHPHVRQGERQELSLPSVRPVRDFQHERPTQLQLLRCPPVQARCPRRKAQRWRAVYTAPDLMVQKYFSPAAWLGG